MEDRKMFTLNISQETIKTVEAVLAEYDISLKETKPELVNCCGWCFDDNPSFHNPRIHLTTIDRRFVANIGFTGKMDIPGLIEHTKNVERVIEILNKLKAIDPKLVYQT